ncbi:hypothetical protein [Vulcanisaeta sp. JCM 16161]|uniref:hypothetical protein n=1 Tax=Vulcanisaeta sp. JCM 16161 TaxID=1295372 RepID=UPI00406BF4B6
MGTTQLWQVIAWLIAWPRKSYMRIDGLGLNDGDIGVMWHLRAIDHRDVFKDKADVAEDASRLGDEEFPIFTLYAVLGDGDVDVKEKSVRLTMGHSKLGLWDCIIDRLKDLGFGVDSDYGCAVAYAVWTSKAVKLAREMFSDGIVKALIEDLAQLPDAEKLRRLIELTGMEVKPLGRSMVEIAGIRISVVVYNDGHVELRAWRKRLEDARAVLKRLRDARYEVELSRRGDRYVVYISMYVIERDQELARRVCEVLRRMLEEAVNKGRERRAKAITRAMERLNCPTQSPRAQQK